MPSKKEKILIIVESPSKCKTIEGYLKSEYESVSVLASYGHIRQLPRANGSVLPNDNFRMVWEKTAHAQKNINNILREAEKVAKSGGSIILATDADREGEAISWHILESMRESGINHPVKRMIFQEITKKSIKEAIENPRDLDIDKVDSYFARLSLDYLVGFNISPILWMKLKGCKSAGRVQSAALRTLVEREHEIVKFKPEKYWTLAAIFEIRKYKYKADLIEWQDKPLEKFMWTEDTVKDAAEVLKQDTYSIGEIKVKKHSRAPYAPYTTSTMQQDASRYFNWRPSKTSMIAQKLYEGLPIDGTNTGLITYMRTDSVRLSDKILFDIQDLVKTNYGDRYFKMRRYAGKSDNVQDAHEAIRPTEVGRKPASIANFLDDDCARLYEMIWRRTVASQMSEAEYEVKNILIRGSHGAWNIHGRERKFDGFLAVIPEEEKEQMIYDISPTDQSDCKKVSVVDHMTQAPGRYTEAGLIKHLDEVGIGRPSTYSSIIDTLHTREYVTAKQKSLIPTHKGFIVTGFLLEMCPEYIQDAFTAGMEDRLDEIATGKARWKSVLGDFWVDFDKKLIFMKEQNAQEVVSRIAKRYSEYFFGGEPNCPKCETGKKILCLLRDSEFIGCSNHPKCDFMESLGSNKTSDAIMTDNGVNVTLKQGPYGYYLHWEGTAKKISVPVAFAKKMTQELAQKLKSLPKVLGKHPFTGQDILLNIGRYGPYVFHDSVYASINADDLDKITLESALEILGAASQRSANKGKPRAKK